MGVNSHLPILNRFYGFTSWSRTRTTPIDCPWIFMINQLGSDQCTWPWGHCLLSELREWRQQTGRHNGLKEFGAPLTIGEAYLKIIMSSFLGFCEWNTRNRWRDGQVCPDVDKELWRLGPDGSGACFGVGQVCPDVDKELWRLGPDGSGVFWGVMRQ
ncbi:hypothetical protein TNCV_4144501 [Trichonephila clavipes]|nr:hypothetical protein TNCV_4144501 [Trichonephila clavipes]